MIVPTISAVCAAILGLLAALLAVQVIRNRVRFNINAGDGGNPVLAQSIRAHSNLAEHGPLALLLLSFAEAGGAWRGLILTLGAALVVARFASAWGLSHSLGPTSARQAGAGLTVLVIVISSLLILYRAAMAL
jgi:uncharacterized membrane protein YecN with MAPEG domain